MFRIIFAAALLLPLASATCTITVGDGIIPCKRLAVTDTMTMVDVDAATLDFESCAAACTAAFPTVDQRAAALSPTKCYCLTNGTLPSFSPFDRASSECSFPCPGNAEQKCGKSGDSNPAVTVIRYACDAAPDTTTAMSASTAASERECEQPADKVPDVTDFCVMQPDGAMYHGEFVQMLEGETTVGRARFSFSLCAGSTATIKVSTHDDLPNLSSAVLVYQTRTVSVQVAAANTSIPATHVYLNPGAEALWVVLDASTTGDSLPSNAAVDVMVSIKGDTSCAAADFATTTMATTTAATDVSSTTTTTTHTKTLLGCPVAGEELQCAFIEEICGKTVEEILEIGRTDPEYEHTPLFLNCVSGLCCACSGENKDRAECRNGTNVESFVHLGEDFPLRKLVEGELKDANIDEICALGKLILPLYQEEFTPCAGASVAYTVPPEKSTPIPGSCRDMDHKHRKHCNQILTGCGFTPMQLEAQAEGATWDTDARMLQCLDTLACGCNFTTQGVCASKTLAAAFPPFQNPAFGDGMEHYNLNNASQYLRSQLEALGREPLPPCIDTGSTVAPTKYPACVEDDPIQCNFFLETCGEPAGYYIDRVIESKWTDPEFMLCVSKLCCACDEGKSKSEECTFGEDLSDVFSFGTDFPGYAAVKLLLKDVTFDAACRLAPILLKGPDYDKRDCPADRTTTSASTTKRTTTTIATTTTASPQGASDPKDDKSMSTIIIVASVCGTVVLVAVIVAVAVSRKAGRKYATGGSSLEFSNPSFGVDPESAVLSFDEPVDFDSEA